MADRIYKLSPEIREALQAGHFRDPKREEGARGVPLVVEEAHLANYEHGIYAGYSWTAVGMVQYLYERCAHWEVVAVDFAAMIGADFAVQMERSARERPLETPTDSLRRLYESSQEKLSAELTAMETDIVAFMDRNSLARDIAKLRTVIQDLLPGGSHAVQAGSELHEALANLYAALKVDIYAPTSTHYDFDWAGPVADTLDFTDVDRPRWQVGEYRYRISPEILSPFAGLSEQYPPEDAEKKDEGQE